MESIITPPRNPHLRERILALLERGYPAGEVESLLRSVKPHLYVVESVEAILDAEGV